MAVTKYNALKQIEETIKVAEKAEFEARRAHARIDALPTPEPPAAPQKGERGATGPAGRDGAASQVPGPAGATGPAGQSIKGDTGLRGPAGPDTAEAIADVRAELAAVKVENADLKFQFLTIREMLEKGSNYVEYLKTRVAARLAAAGAKQQ
jgi:hypothetical protein